MAESEWDGVTLRSTYNDGLVALRDRLADAARDGDWPAVFTLLGTAKTSVNNWRVGGASWYSVLHQAAWHGADTGTVVRLVEAGGWRTLRTHDGQCPEDIAAQRGHRHLAELLAPAPRHPVSRELREGLERGLHSVVMTRAGNLVAKERLRLPELDPLTELANPSCWFPVPGMYGGFGYRLDGEELEVKSWCRVSGGSGQTHRITAHAVELVDSGWA